MIAPILYKYFIVVTQTINSGLKKKKQNIEMTENNRNQVLKMFMSVIECVLNIL